jgi:hypothetical protein
MACIILRLRLGLVPDVGSTLVDRSGLSEPKAESLIKGNGRLDTFWIRQLQTLNTPLHVLFGAFSRPLRNALDSVYDVMEAVSPSLEDRCTTVTDRHDF